MGRLDGKIALIVGAGSVGPGWGNERACAAVFAAGDESRFITGTEIVVDGGMTARCD